MIAFNKGTAVLRSCFVATMLSMLLLESTGAVANAETVRTGVVQINDGSPKGYKSDRVDMFLGIPYAAPPIGPLRWMSPQPVNPWHKVLDALAFGNTLVQTMPSKVRGAEQPRRLPVPERICAGLYR